MAATAAMMEAETITEVAQAIPVAGEETTQAAAPWVAPAAPGISRCGGPSASASLRGGHTQATTSSLGISTQQVSL